MKKRFLALALAVIMSLSFITVISTSAEVGLLHEPHICRTYIPAGIEYYYGDSRYSDHPQLDLSYKTLLRYVTVNSNEFGNVEHLGDELGRDPFIFQRVEGDSQRWLIAQATEGRSRTIDENRECTIYCVPVFYNGTVENYYVKLIKKASGKYNIRVKAADENNFDGDEHLDEEFKQISCEDGKFVEYIEIEKDEETEVVEENRTYIFYSPLIFNAVEKYAKADLAKEENYGEYFDEELFSVSWKYENNYFSNSVEKLLFGVLDFTEENLGLGSQSTLEDHRYTNNENHSTPYYLTAVEGVFTTQQLYPSVSCLFTFYEQSAVEINKDNYLEHCDFVECEEHRGSHIVRCKYCDKTLGEEECTDQFTLTTTIFGTEYKKEADGYCDKCEALINGHLAGDAVSVNLISYKFGASKLAKFFGFTEKTYFLYKIKVDTEKLVGHNDDVAVVMYSFDGLTWKSGNLFITSEAKEKFWIKTYYTDDDIRFYECRTAYDDSGRFTASAVAVIEVENVTSFD